MVLTIQPDGTLTGIYSEQFDLGEIGRATVRRASHCEPDEAGRWWADLSPSGGPKLGPFAKRSESIAAEVEWLEKHLHTLEV